MDVKKFAMSLNALAVNFGLIIREGYTELMADNLDLSDDELETAMRFFLAQTNISKMPSIAEWKEASGMDMRSEVAKEEERFLRKVSAYLSSGFVCRDEKADFIRSLSNVESLVLQRLGGISELWSACHRSEYRKSLNSILREVQETYREMVTEQNVNVGLPGTEKIEDGRMQNLLAGTVKRLS